MRPCISLGSSGVAPHAYAKGNAFFTIGYFAQSLGSSLALTSWARLSGLRIRVVSINTLNLKFQTMSDVLRELASKSTRTLVENGFEAFVLSFGYNGVDEPQPAGARPRQICQ